MRKLHPSMMRDFEIENHRPQKVNCIFFGDSERLLGTAARLMDACGSFGIAAVQAGAHGRAAALNEQGGLFTVVVRGENETDGTRINRTEVVQCVLEGIDPSADEERVSALAADTYVTAAVIERDDTGEFPARDALFTALLTRFLLLKKNRMTVLVLGSGAAQREACAELARCWGCTLDNAEFVSSSLDSLCASPAPEEALSLCRKENYTDSLIHICEPYARWVAERTDAAFYDVFPRTLFDTSLSYEKECLLRARVFDAGLFAFAAPGLLRGDATLADCMRDEALRKLAGTAVMDEVLPFLPAQLTREEAAARVIESFARYENAMNAFAVERAAHGLAARFVRGVLPAMKAYARENFAPPPNLTMAFGAMILLYADARPAAQGYETPVGEDSVRLYDSPRVLSAFARLSSDMPADALSYAVCADRELWGEDLREIDGLETALENAFSDRLQ